MAYYTYILASRPHDGAFYTGVTSDLIKRIHEHRQKAVPGFASKYNVTLLVYYEIHDEIEWAIRREKTIKRWTRAKKIAAIEDVNPHWNDLYSAIFS